MIRPLTLIVVSIFCSLILFQSVSVSAEIDPYVSHPSNIPKVNNKLDPATLPAGDKAVLTLEYTNQYVNDTNKVTILADIGGFWLPNQDEIPELANLTHKPQLYPIDNAFQYSDQDLSLTLGDVEPGQMVTKRFGIMSHEKTTQGSYKLRFQLTFEYNETFRIMRTSAHFDDALWLEAVQENPINLTLLGVDGIIAFTMVKVIEPDSSAPFPGFIGIGLAMAVAYIIEWRRQRAPP